MTDHELIAELRAVAGAVDVPATRDLTAAVRSEIAALPVRRRRHKVAWVARAAGVGAAVLVAMLVLVSVSPRARVVVGDWLRIGGIDIGIGEIPSEVEVGDPLPRAREVSLDDARSTVTYPVQVPRRLGEPQRVYLDDSFAGGAVSMVWAPRASLPEVDPGVGALLTVFQAQVDQAYLTKIIGSFDGMERVQVDGSRGIWFGGPPHLLVRQPDGREREVGARLAGNTLIWEQSGVTYRLETALDRDAALRVGNSMR